MHDWTHGYVTDVEYTAYYYPELAPMLMHFCALSKNVVSKAPHQPYHWLEIGCGNGLSANALAASNMQSQFYAFDFNPAHILQAQKLANDAGLHNIHFFDDSFEQALQRELPQMDYIVLHGIYSWISKENQQHIIRLISKFLKTGGIVYISYNCMPGLAAKSPLRHLMKEFADRQGGDLLQKVGAIKSFMSELKEANFQYMVSSPEAIKMIDKLMTHNENYIAHEYLNADWELFYSNEIAADMRAAKLHFAASAGVIENADEANYDPVALVRIKQETDPEMRELLKDFARNRQFRRDLFVKGKREYSADELELLLDSLCFTLFIPRDECHLKVTFNAGSADLSEKVYVPILDTLAKSPASIRTLMEAAKLSLPSMVHSLSILFGLGYVHVIASKENESDAATCKAFNNVVLERNLQGEKVHVLVSPRLRTAFNVNEIDQYFIYCYLQRSDNLSASVFKIMKKLGKYLLKEGKKMEGDELQLQELREKEAIFLKNMIPLLTNLGVV